MNLPFRVFILGIAYRFQLLIAKMTKIPIIGKIIYQTVFKTDKLLYLPCDKTIQINQRITPESMVLPSQVVKHFIEKANYHWIMDFCICRKSGNCQNYPVEWGCLFLGEAATKIDPRIGHRVTKKEALEYAQQCSDAGLIQLIGKHKIDTLWLDVGPGNKLLTICNCCPCCCGWTMLPNFSLDIRSKVTKMPGVAVFVSDACTGCGVCEEVCFAHAIEIGEKAVITDACVGCGRCVKVCPQNAIKITVDDESIKKSIQHISEVVDVT
ncbi:MAG: 4Fe-4S binding protein [Candidatus Methanofastidiosia archaeon]|jgi:ferredoxin